MPTGPKDGDVVLHCDHLDRHGCHFFLVDNMPFRQPNGELLTAKWIIQCNECYATLPRNPKVEEFVIQGHSYWIGDDPVIQNPVYEQN